MIDPTQQNFSDALTLVALALDAEGVQRRLTELRDTMAACETAQRELAAAQAAHAAQVEKDCAERAATHRRFAVWENDLKQRDAALDQRREAYDRAQSQLGRLTGRRSEEIPGCAGMTRTYYGDEHEANDPHFVPPPPVTVFDESRGNDTVAVDGAPRGLTITRSLPNQGSGARRSRPALSRGA